MRFSAHCLSRIQSRTLAHEIIPPSFSVHLAHLSQLCLELHGARRLIRSMILDSVQLHLMLAATETAQ